MGILTNIADRLVRLEAAWHYQREKARARRAVSRFQPPYRLNLGCGATHFEGWMNMDFASSSAVDVRWDVTRGLPLADNSCEFVYNEHVLEHFSLQQAAGLLRECHRVLQPGGVLRIAMPNIAEPVRQYYENDWRGQPWIAHCGYDIRTGAEMLNIAFRDWGHQWLYDQEELTRRLREADFAEIYPVPWGESEHAQLRGRETRKETLLVCEARKHDPARPAAAAQTPQTAGTRA